MSPVQKYTPTQLQGIAASFDLAAELITLGNIPKEREQILLLDRCVRDCSSRMKAYQTVIDTIYSKQESYVDPLIAFVSDAIECIPVTSVVHRQLLSSNQEVHEMIREDFRIGKARKLYERRPEVEQWIDDVVGEVCGVLESEGALRATNGRALFKTFAVLRFVYGQLLAHLTPYIVPEQTQRDHVLCSFANVAISDIRGAMLCATLSRFNANPAFKDVGPEFIVLAAETAGNNLALYKLSARSAFDLVRHSVSRFCESPYHLHEVVRDFAILANFGEMALPHLQEYLRRAPDASAKINFFVPGQIAFVDVSADPNEPNVYGSFESHSDTVSVAVRVAGCDEASHTLSGLGLPDAFQFSARNSLGVIMNAQGKIFSSWAQRLVKTTENAETERARSTIQGCVDVQQAKLAELWERRPELLGIITDNEPTVVIFDGAKVFVLGPCLDPKSPRAAFFARSDQSIMDDVLTRAGLDLDEPSVWLVRCLVDGSEHQGVVPTIELPENEISRRDTRRAFRAAVHQTGRMNYRSFVSSLSSWDVVETTDGHGGHGSLKRCVDGRELRAGTWGALRDPNPNVEFGQMYEILENLEIPVEEYTQYLLSRIL